MCKRDTESVKQANASEICTFNYFRKFRYYLSIRELLKGQMSLASELSDSLYLKISIKLNIFGYYPDQMTPGTVQFTAY